MDCSTDLVRKIFIPLLHATFVFLPLKSYSSLSAAPPTYEYDIYYWRRDDNVLQKGLSSENQTQWYTLTHYDLLVTRKTLEKSCIYFYPTLWITADFYLPPFILWITMWTNVLIVDNFHLSASSNILNAATKRTIYAL